MIHVNDQQAMEQLEAMVDRYGVAEVLYALANTCYHKRDARRKDDADAARQWDRRGGIVGQTAYAIEQNCSL